MYWLLVGWGSIKWHKYVAATAVNIMYQWMFTDWWWIGLAISSCLSTDTRAAVDWYAPGSWLLSYQWYHSRYIDWHWHPPDSWQTSNQCHDQYSVELPLYLSADIVKLYFTYTSLTQLPGILDDTSILIYWSVLDQVSIKQWPIYWLIVGWGSIK